MLPFYFVRKKSLHFFLLADIAVLGVSAGYVFGRIGNFFNQELVGRITDVPWGIYVDGTLRHPSQLYEAFLEGILIFIILFVVRKYKTFDGQLAILYGILYSIARIIAELFRQPDIQLGFIYSDWLTMGMLQSTVFAIFCTIVYLKVKTKSKN